MSLQRRKRDSLIRCTLMRMRAGVTPAEAEGAVEEEEEEVRPEEAEVAHVEQAEVLEAGADRLLGAIPKPSNRGAGVTTADLTPDITPVVAGLCPVVVVATRAAVAVTRAAVEEGAVAGGGDAEAATPGSVVVALATPSQAEAVVVAPRAAASAPGVKLLI
jgi:hypothetical protein